MRITSWMHPHKSIIVGLMIMSLVCDGSFLLMPFSGTGNLAFAQKQNTPPMEEVRPKGKQPSPDFKRDGAGKKQVPRQAAPADARRNPSQTPVKLQDKNRKPNPGKTPAAPMRPASPKKPGKQPPKQPAERHNAHSKPPKPYYGQGRPLPPRPHHVKPPTGPGPWQTTPWQGHGPSPWWFGRPFVWSLATAATVTAIAGVTYYLVSGTYYRPYKQGNTTVYVQVPAP